MRAHSARVTRANSVSAVVPLDARVATLVAVGGDAAGVDHVIDDVTTDSHAVQPGHTLSICIPSRIIDALFNSPIDSNYKYIRRVATGGFLCHVLVSECFDTVVIE